MRRGPPPPQTPARLFGVYDFSFLLPWNKLFDIHQRNPLFLAVEALEFSELKTPLVYTLKFSSDLRMHCLKHVQSNLVPSRLLPNSCLLNTGRGSKSNRTSRLFPGSKATKFVRTRGFSKLTRFRNTENLDKKTRCLDMDGVKTLSIKVKITSKIDSTSETDKKFQGYFWP